MPKNLCYLISIETHARAFLPLNKSAIGSVKIDGRVQFSVFLRMQSRFELNRHSNYCLDNYMISNICLNTQVSKYYVYEYSTSEGFPLHIALLSAMVKFGLNMV